MRIAFFPGCLVDMMYPEVGIAAVQVLERLGCEIELPRNEICCGQMFLNSGYERDTIPLMKQVVDAYAGYDTIVSLSGSCLHAIVNEYPPYLEDDPHYGPLLARVRENSWEFTEFIVKKLGITDVGAHLDATVTYHKSCHLTRLLGVKDAPIQLLQGVEGLRYVVMEQADRCCGFGGTFSVKQPEISGEIVKEKCRTVLDTGAEVLIGADVPCLMNIKGALERMLTEGETDRVPQIMHIAQVLDSGVN